MDTQTGRFEPDPRRASDRTSGFNLLANPFALLGATSQTLLIELRATADGDDAREAAAASLSVPRSRLAAEVAFLPGAAEVTGAVLERLRRGERYDAAGLPSLAAANVRAHLCAVGLAAETDLSGLAAAAFVEEAVVADIDADRRLAGMPAVQLAALRGEIDTLTDLHAGALVAAVSRQQNPAKCLVDLLRSAPVPGSPLLRRATAAWARQTSTALSQVGAAASVAAAAWTAQPSEATAAPLCNLVRQWAALSLPQRLADASAALDHAVTVRTLQPWRAAAKQVADRGLPEFALPVTELLAESFADLPGQAAALRDEARACAGLLEERVLAHLLLELRQQADRIAAAPAGLQAALRTRPFGPLATGDAAPLWAAFAAACAAATLSEAPYVVMQGLIPAVGGEHRPEGAAAALALQTGLAQRAEQDGHAELAARLRAAIRGLERAVALHEYVSHSTKKWSPWWLAPLKRRRSLRALRRVLPLVDDPGQRQRLVAAEAQLQRRIRTGRIGALLVVVLAGAISAVVGLDDDYAKHAPYRQGQAQSFAAATPLSAPAPAPVPTPFAGPSPFASPVPMQDVTPVPHYAFPAHAGEREPQLGLAMLGSTELRWCVANDIRLEGAQAAATSLQRRGLDVLADDWHRRCSDPGVRRGELAAMRSEVERNRTRLTGEGLAILRSNAS